MKKITIITIIIIITVILTPQAFAQTATLSLSPSSGTFNKSCSFSLDIVLNANGAQTDGADAILIYDASRFTATSVTNGTVYADYPGNTIDTDGGKVTISGLASFTQSFNGQGTFGTINFTVKDNALAGASQIKFDFDPLDKAKTTDSNVADHDTASDILNSVVNGNYTIGTGTCAVASPSPGLGGGTKGGQGATGLATPSGSESPNLPPAGSEALTTTLAIAGVVLTILGILGLAFL